MVDLYRQLFGAICIATSYRSRYISFDTVNSVISGRRDWRPHFPLGLIHLAMSVRLPDWLDCSITLDESNILTSNLVCSRMSYVRLLLRVPPPKLSIFSKLLYVGFWNFVCTTLTTIFINSTNYNFIFIFCSRRQKKIN